MTTTDVRSPDLEEISSSALLYAARFPAHYGASFLATRLYIYNRYPLSARLRRRLPDARAVLRYLLSGNGSTAAATLERGWLPQARPARLAGWNLWMSRRGRSNLPATHKLYVSAALSHVRDAFQEVVGCFAGADAVSFKTGGTVDFLVRPDRLIVYFTSFDALTDGADALHSRLAGMPAHGVPFSAPLFTDALLSWGMDPPRVTPAGSGSWRAWLTNELAHALLDARAGTPAERSQAACDAAAELGVDATTWAPRPDVWRDLPPGD